MSTPPTADEEQSRSLPEDRDEAQSPPVTFSSQHELENEGDDGDDDMEYEPPTEDDEGEDDEMGDDRDGDDDYQDMESTLSGEEIIFAPYEGSQDREEEGEDEGEDEGSGNEQAHEGEETVGSGRVSVLSGEDLRALFGGQAGLTRFIIRRLAGFTETSEEDARDYLHGGTFSAFRTRRQRRERGPQPGDYPDVPSEAGTELMSSGTFGDSDRYRGNGMAKKSNIASRLLYREHGFDHNGLGSTTNRLIAQSMIPSSRADFVIQYRSSCYSGQFSADGDFFFSCAQDFKVRMYDTSNPYRWKYYKKVSYQGGNWTITDASLSPDNKFLAYSSIAPIVYLAATDPTDDSDPSSLDFSNNGSVNNGYIGIWSIRFSGDGRELVAGAREGSVYVYDLETRQTILRIRGHETDVNAVCYGDQSSPHLLYSGSDDTTLKVWDRRSMGDGREAGVFLGHREGLTYVDSKGDGRYVLSNGKDQTMKLWDLRKMVSTQRFDEVKWNRYTSGFDYRNEDYEPLDYKPHPEDCSVVTFRGHRVLRTLIRCHFSPPGSTNSRYVYTGSSDGAVYIYNLDATLAGKVDVSEASPEMSRRCNARHAGYAYYGRSASEWACVRDASWHPYAPVIAATSWNGTCSVHSWTDGVEEDEAEPRMGTTMNEKLEYDDESWGTSDHRRFLV